MLDIGAPAARLMDTGGMKTEKRASTRMEFVRQVKEVFDIPAESCINEYGMCEMSSQFYGRGESSRLEGPAWVLRRWSSDPATGQEAAFGRPGILRHYDLANVDSVMAIQTEDLGRAENQGFTLLGRASNADLKGCIAVGRSFLA